MYTYMYIYEGREEVQGETIKKTEKGRRKMEGLLKGVNFLNEKSYVLYKPEPLNTPK